VLPFCAENRFFRVHGVTVNRVALRSVKVVGIFFARLSAPW